MTQPLTDTPTYDAILIVSFGGPEGQDEVIPFLEKVLEGKRVPRERLLEVAHHYDLFNGISPLNQQNRDLMAALKVELESNNLNLPIYLGNRHWHPFLADTLQQMVSDGVKNVLAFFTSAYSSEAGCRVYLEAIDKARAEVGPDAPNVYKLRTFFNHPGFVNPNIEAVKTALAQIPTERQAKTHIAFTAHSIPISMANNCSYVAELKDVANTVIEAVNHKNWQLVYQSRSGPPHQPWLEPDIEDHLRELKTQGIEDVIIAPIGFTSDHMEVMYDLDTEAKEICEELNLNMVRAATVGTHPTFVKMIRELIAERLNPNTPKRYVGSLAPAPDFCPADCCIAK